MAQYNIYYSQVYIYEQFPYLHRLHLEQTWAHRYESQSSTGVHTYFNLVSMRSLDCAPPRAPPRAPCSFLRPLQGPSRAPISFPEAAILSTRTLGRRLAKRLQRNYGREILNISRQVIYNIQHQFWSETKISLFYPFLPNFARVFVSLDPNFDLGLGWVRDLLCSRHAGEKRVGYLG